METSQEEIAYQVGWQQQEQWKSLVAIVDSQQPTVAGLQLSTTKFVLWQLVFVHAISGQQIATADLLVEEYQAQLHGWGVLHDKKTVWYYWWKHSKL